jgi:hypothetical protein
LCCHTDLKHWEALTSDSDRDFLDVDYPKYAGAGLSAPTGVTIRLRPSSLSHSPSHGQPSDLGSSTGLEPLSDLLSTLSSIATGMKDQGSSVETSRTIFNIIAADAEDRGLSTETQSLASSVDKDTEDPGLSTETSSLASSLNKDTEDPGWSADTSSRTVFSIIATGTHSVAGPENLGHDVLQDGIERSEMSKMLKDKRTGMYIESCTDSDGDSGDGGSDSNSDGNGDGDGDVHCNVDRNSTVTS